MVCCGSGSPWPVVRVSIAACRWNSSAYSSILLRAANLLCQPVPELGMRDVAGCPAQIEGILAVFQGKRVHRVSRVAVEVFLLWRRDDECVQPGVGEQRAHRMQPWPAVSPHCAEERQADPEVIQQVGSLTGKVGLLGFEVSPRDHDE